MNVSVAVSRQRGEEGTPALVNEAAGDFRVQLFFQLVRGCSAERIRALVNAVLAEAEAQKSAEHVADLFLVAFQTRNCRGGKGEKQLFYILMSELLQHYPQTCLRVAELIPRHGYWKDLFQIASVLQADLAAVIEKQSGKKGAAAPELDQEVERREKILQQWIELVVFLSVQTLNADRAKLAGEADASAPAAPGAAEEKAESEKQGTGLTLLAKYFPNELKKKKRHKRKAALESGGSDGWAMSGREVLATQPIKWFNFVADRMFGSKHKGSVKHVGRKELRQLLTALRARLNVTESLMSARRWGDINVSKVASLCLMRQRQAFQRHCAASMNRAILEKRVNAVQLFPHEIAQKLLDDLEAAYICEVLGEPVAVLLSENDKTLFELQWEKIRADIRAKMQQKLAEERARVAAETEEGGNAGSETSPAAPPAMPLNNIVPIVDMSGSMHGTPVAVAVAFGILLSELVECPHYRNRVLTFASQPEWFEFVDDMHPTLLSKIQALRSIQDRCGESTNIRLAFERVLAVAVEQGLSQEQLPELVVLSDMQFTDTSAGASWETEYEATRAKFAAAGYEVPLLTFWNLRSVEPAADGGNGGETGAMPAAASMPGVRLLSGFSPHLMKTLLNGEFVEEEVSSDEESEDDDAKDCEPTAGVDGSVAEGESKSEADEGQDEEQPSGAAAAQVDEGAAAAQVDEGAAAAQVDEGVAAMPRERRVNPLATLQKTLSDSVYDDVREVLSSMSEKLLQPVSD